MRGVGARAIGLLAIPVVLVAGCGTGAVDVPAPSPGPSALGLCRKLHDRLPGHVHGESRRSVRPDSELVAAWGSPAIALRCGVGRPRALRPTSVLAVVDGVSWLPVPEDRPTTFTAVGRRAYVEVTVPSEYSPPGEVLTDFAVPITTTIPAAADGSI